MSGYVKVGVVRGPRDESTAWVAAAHRFGGLAVRVKQSGGVWLVYRPERWRVAK